MYRLVPKKTIITNLGKTEYETMRKMCIYFLQICKSF
jgi:hypothetical protein